MTERRILSQDVRAALEYYYPISRTLLTATTEGGAEVLAVIRDQSLGLVERLTVSNQTGTTASLFLYAVPSGATIGAANREVTAMPIPGNTNVDLTELIGGLYEPGLNIRAYASTGNALFVSGYIRSLI